MEFEAVVFDFDGLMIESEVIALRVWKEVVAAFNGDMDDGVNRLLIGKTPEAGVQIVRDTLALPIQTEELKQIYWDRRITRMCEEAEPVDGLEELIGLMLINNVRLGVASNSPVDYVEQVLKAIQLRRYMESVVGSDQVQVGKPAPDVYIEAARRLGVPPGSILALEDSPTGVSAAIQAGMTCYAIPNPGLVAEDFSKAHKCFASMVDLYTHFLNMM
jgi:HAD superfamily hydrolase (TIGR01509 family)